MAQLPRRAERLTVWPSTSAQVPLSELETPGHGAEREKRETTLSLW